MKHRIVSFLTDFGLTETYVGQVKAVLSNEPLITVIDLCHAIPSFQVRIGAFELLRSFSHFPKGTIHLAVVDPGVGSNRRCLWVQSEDYQFVGPDNGLLTWVIHHLEEAGEKIKCFEIPVSVRSTFQARDVFAPAILEFVKTQKIDFRPAPPIKRLPFSKFQKTKNNLEATVLTVDHYGNVILNVPISVALKGKWNKTTVDSYPSYEAIPEGKIGVVQGSHGFWEITSNKGTGQKLLQRLKVDDHLLFTF